MINRKFRLLFCIYIVAFSFTACNNSKKNISKSSEITFTKEGTLQLKKASNDSVIKTLDIEIADDEYQTQTGLMYRNSMKESQGMLFIFPNEISRSFYMKNTRIPLDIIYISADSTIVSFQKNAKPFDETSLPSNAPAKYVLEINAGLSDAWNIEIGDKIKF
ncbi:DUF192 domain-containing protein [Winogradskyella haliclonae]|uniref:DUF192 domain-containing protein n=1 Tax=Winogradskyella haliclonae TaxID=2048558 RepID=A0ABQ2C2C6_9FLAO|nr:DUF192 domain-containing protein [Winogradskyella haliclonae]GGI58207.1 hypothetical protein GCM10011444_25160 [Winogradskyella haliclonae]